MPWLQAFKLALIKEDEKKLSSLMDTLPQFDTEEEMQEAAILIEQAIDFFKELEKSSSLEMKKIRLAKKYLEH